MYASASASTWTPWFYETLASDELKTAALEAFDPFGACQTLCNVGVATALAPSPVPCGDFKTMDLDTGERTMHCIAPAECGLVEQWAGSEGWNDKILTPVWHMLVIGAHMLVFALLCCAGCCGSNRRCPAFLCVNKWRFEFADCFPTFAVALRKFETCTEACCVKQGFVRCCHCFVLCCGDGLELKIVLITAMPLWISAFKTSSQINDLAQ